MEASRASRWTKFLRGKIEILQPVGGPRFSIDSVLLAGFCHIREGEDILDLGTGTGVVAAILHAHHHPRVVAGIEIQEDLHECASATAERNGCDPGEMVLGDIRDDNIFKDRRFDAVVSNPPFFKTGAGRNSENEGRRLSRHTEGFSLKDLFAAGSRCLKPGGRLMFIIPFSDREEAVEILEKNGLWPRLSRPVIDTLESPPKRILIQAVNIECFHTELPPLVIKESDGSYTSEVKVFLGDAPFLEDPSFFCDAMVGRLSKYLRFAGFDTAYLRDADDDWLIGECEKSGRILITRDRPLCARMKKRKMRFIEPQSVHPREQFKEVLSLFPPDRHKARRCLLCNAAVIRVEKEKAEGKVPAYTHRTHGDFFICPSCGKLTWGGTHLARFEKEILDIDR